MLLISMDLFVVFVGVFQTVNSQAINPENNHIHHTDEQLKLNNPVPDLKTQVQDLTSQALQQLREEMKHHNSKIQQLENHILRVENENTNHKEELLHLKAQLKSQELYTHDRLNSYQTESFQKIQALNTTLSKHMAKMNTYVTFTAYATAERDYNTDDVVLFDGLVVNSEFYDSIASIFTCPYSGFYLFAVSVRVHASLISVDIRMDDIYLVSAIGSDDANNDQGSALVVTRCDEGQKVWIRSRADGFRMQGSRHSSFTGTLLRVI